MRLLFSVVVCLVFCAPASATVIEIGFTGILTSTTDTTGNVFGNGTAANSGVGTEVTGTYRLTLGGNGYAGQNNGVTLYEWDVEGSGSYQPPSAFYQYTINVGDTEYSSDLNFGNHNTLVMADQGPTQTTDSLYVSSRNNGHYQTGPTVNGMYDYLALTRRLQFSFEDTSGSSINGLDFSNSINWISGVNGTGSGSFLLSDQLWSAGTDHLYTGTPGNFLTDATGKFSLTSLTSHTIPEPSSFALLALGLLGILIIKNKTIFGRASE